MKSIAVAAPTKVRAFTKEVTRLLQRKMQPMDERRAQPLRTSSAVHQDFTRPGLPANASPDLEGRNKDS